jgi:Ca2+-binding EF-hand superfamily protein
MAQVTTVANLLSIGSIGVEELEKPLISLGLCNTRQEVQNIIDDVDEDDSGQIEFNEFLHIIKSASQR